MNPSIIKLFREALDLAPAERVAFLDAQNISAEERAQLNALLLASEQTHEGLPALDVPALQSAKGMDRSGQRVGAFRLISSLGSGGMGAVWLAERVGEFTQKVAIKWLHAGLSETARARFARERDTLAKLEHPGIARIVDGGEDGEASWFAMEYVDGQTLDQYVRDSLPTLSERLRLVLSISDAVQYAHQNLVVHRDLKPGNILVTREGQPKLLDFGVAKLLSGAQHTDSRAPLTFAYAAPEQIKGEAITTATDVYALGVILFELLTGERPHKLKSALAGDASLSLLQAITDTDATAPSQVLSLRTNTSNAGKIRYSQLKGDLDTIVLKALSRDPSRRYASVLALKEDLTRFLEHEPIQARADSHWYRLRKFARRNRAVVAVSLCLLAAIIGFAWQSQLQTQRVRAALAQSESERARANQAVMQTEQALSKVRIEARQADALATHLAHVLTLAQGAGASVSTEQLMRWAGDAKLSGVYADASMNLSLQLAIADLLMVKNDFASALAVLNGLKQQIPTASPQEQLQAAANRIRALTKLGKLEEADATLTAALALPVENNVWRAQLLANQAELRRAQGRSAESADAAREAARISLALKDDSPLAVGATMHSAAVLLMQADALDDAQTIGAQALEIWRKGEISSSTMLATVQATVANTLFLRGHIQSALAQFAEAEAKALPSESVPARSARATGRAKALALVGQAKAAIDIASAAQSAMCKANGESSMDCLQMTLSLADTCTIAADTTCAGVNLEKALALLKATPIAPLQAAAERMRVRLALYQGPSVSAAEAFVALLDVPNIQPPVRRSAVRALLLAAEHVRKQDAAAALVLANTAIKLSAEMPKEVGGMDRSLLEIWRARAAGVEPPAAARDALRAAIGEAAAAY
jgi:eukaryotic-like serine/threonine-protein kinase